MASLEEAIIQCPCCWQRITVLVDCSLPNQEYIEDCQVCCRPLILSVVVGDGGCPEVSARPEDD